MYKQIIDLFEKDSRLKRTIPKSYTLDPEKVKMWNDINDFNTDPMEVVKVSFQDWQLGFAKCLEKILSDLEEGVIFFMSTGVLNLNKQSASELWTYYIARKILENNQVMFSDINQYWTKAFKGRANGKTNILFVDDFVFSGIHMSLRICSSIFPIDHFDKIIVAVGTIPSDCKWIFCMKDLQEEYGVNLIDRIEIFAGLKIDLPRASRLLLDHKSLEELNDDLHFGFVGQKGYIGSLILDADPTTPYQHPPPLYHLEFGNGKLPESHVKLVPIRGKPGFYKNSASSW